MDYERGGVPVEHLRRVQEHGDDGTVLPDCAKVYLPLLGWPGCSSRSLSPPRATSK